MKSSLRGVIHRKVIELEQGPGLPDGQEVSVRVDVVSAATSPTSRAALTALRRAAGSWADDEEEWDRYLEWNRTPPALSYWRAELSGWAGYSPCGGGCSVAASGSPSNASTVIPMSRAILRSSTGEMSRPL